MLTETLDVSYLLFNRNFVWLLKMNPFWALAKSGDLNFYTSICETPRQKPPGLGQELFAGNRKLSKNDFKNWGSPFSQYLVVQVCCLSRIPGTLWKSVRSAIPVVKHHPNRGNSEERESILHMSCVYLYKYMHMIQVSRNPTPHTMKCTNRDHLESIYIIYIYIDIICTCYVYVSNKIPSPLCKLTPPSPNLWTGA